jgi:hypothetical protein
MAGESEGSRIFPQRTRFFVTSFLRMTFEARRLKKAAKDATVRGRMVEG